MTNVINEETPSNSQIPKPVSTPTIPSELYQLFPVIIQEACKFMKSDREKDMLLIAALAVCSGCLPDVFGLYNNSKIYPHLYALISAPPSSHKSVAKWAIK